MSADRREQKAGRGNLSRFGRFIRLNLRANRLRFQLSRRYVISAYIVNLIQPCVSYWNIFWSARLLDEVLGGRRVRELGLYTALLLGGAFLLMLIGRFCRYIYYQEMFGFSQNVQKLFAEKMTKADYSLLESERFQNLYQRTQRETIGSGLGIMQNYFCGLVSYFVSGAAGIAMVWGLFERMRDYPFGIAAFLALIILALWLSARAESKNELCFIECDNRIGENCVERDGFEQYLGNYEKGKNIRIYGIGQLMISRLMEAHHFNDRALDDRNRGCLKATGAGGFWSEFSLFVMRAATAVSALLGHVSIGKMTQYVESMQHVVSSIQNVAAFFTSMWHNTEYLERFFELLDMKSEMKKGVLPVEKRMDRDYRIVFDHVSFRYPGCEQYALKDICMEFKIGEKLAVVGKNGSGKTTFIKLLSRLYDPTEGAIYLNGIDIRRYQYEEYMSLFSVVFQDFQLFSFSLGENVAVSEAYDREEVSSALFRAGLDEFIRKLPEGLDTTLYRNFDEKGVEVSGGEAQKLALARAICKGAPFVLLDEPTAALDPVAEYEIYSRFNELVADRTTVYISHRMSSCRFCGDIAVFDEGRLVQRGSHEELMKKTDGMYAKLWTAQAQYYNNMAR